MLQVPDTPGFTDAARAAPSEGVSLRRYPYPYEAMLAICSDLDSTPDWQCYWEIMRFLNTSDAMPMGRGVGLEVGNSIYFDQRPEEFAYWNTDEAGRAMVRALIRSGHIDCLHSYGNLATTREHASRALDELARHDLRLEVWVDHGWSPTNFGADVMRGHGAEPGHLAYHADLTIAQGVRYVWRGRVTSVVGQDAAHRVGRTFCSRHPLRSSRAMAKEFAKHVLGRWGSEKYAMHGPNRLLRLTRLQDGTSVWEFLRSNPHWSGVSSCDTGRGLAEVLTDTVLQRLIERAGVCVLYTHLGKGADPQVPIPPPTQEALRCLARRCGSGDILVTTTHRLLRYLTVRDSLRYHCRREGGTLVIVIDGALDALLGFRPLRPEEVQGLTFETPAAAAVEIEVSGAGRLPTIVSHATDRTFVRVPWQRLAFPQI